MVVMSIQLSNGIQQPPAQHGAVRLRSTTQMPCTLWPKVAHPFRQPVQQTLALPSSRPRPHGGCTQPVSTMDSALWLRRSP
ncbi:hypothetical protein V496_03114 [Pseudogymnoascus sp. VKM F-4515 (FW-2607)]|nr:hypothetical protein V496_03114 [Pseudogymnoascus sp. VKM F-4515 (FW-2607)]